MAEFEILQKILAVLNADIDSMKRLFERVHRGDPRVCRPEYANPKYHEKFGYDE